MCEQACVAAQPGAHLGLLEVADGDGALVFIQLRLLVFRNGFDP